MTNLLLKIKTLLQKIRGIFPSATPRGLEEFETWANSIIQLYKPAADERSVKFALSAMLMRLNPGEAYKSKLFFALCLHKAASAQVAANVMENIKNAQKAEFAASQAAVVTAPAAANESQQ